MRAVSPTQSLSRRAKRLVLLGADAFLILACLPLAVILHGAPLALLNQPALWTAVVAIVPLVLYTFQLRGLYRVVLRYITGAAMPAIMTGAGLGAIGFLGMAHLLGLPVPPGLIATHAVLLLLTVSGLRFGLRTLMRKPALREARPIIIYGAGRAGQQLVAALFLSPEYRPVAFVDDDTRMHGTTINGVRVYPPAELRRLCEYWHIREVLMAMPSLNRQRRRRIISRLETLGVEVKTIPAMGDLVAGKARVTDLRPVMPEDMLGRDPVPPRADLMARHIKDKVVLVTGAGGTIGAELCRQILTQNPRRLIMLDVCEFALYSIATELRDQLGEENEDIVRAVLGSVQNQSRMRIVLQQFAVQTVYHAAAYKHVNMVEENLIEGLRNNVFGTKVMVQAAADCGVENFTLVSTDKTVRPTSVMGASKRLAELICQAEAQRGGSCTFSMVRFGNVLGSSGSVIPRFHDQIARGGPVTVTHSEVTRYFMTIPEAAQLVIQAGAMARGGDVFVLDMGKPVRILDLAKSMIRLHGLVPYILDEKRSPEMEAGDIPIQFIGLKPGEKLHEELLIAGNPRGTKHPRIMAASELALSPEALDALLEQIWLACKSFDLPSLQAMLRAAPLDYRAPAHEIRDVLWPEVEIQRPVAQLRVVAGRAGTAS
ncbi:polysaccharide biosynthesis protein [Natronohydrobacter thiooxidans]|uniref:polysaccharide biosynthesis protein n=1 Tax=Natronohydrobacter thiooxidans TaxID=87172 RepID=UPI0008FF4F64|nr:nucleoside-diphosphate sugar epimerase/dehydratase [Natronohydrobacter thiooxidans]